VRSGGADGNERLTAATSVVLVGLLAGLGVTILAIGPLVWWHVLLGMLLVPPLLLKLGSTGWRVVRYYTGAPDYVRCGPPPLPLRLLAPLVVASTVAVVGTGLALLATGPSGGILTGLHKAAFVVWFVVTALHVLARLPRIPRLVTADWRRGTGPAARTPGRVARRLLVAGSVVVGVALALATVRYAQPWVHWFAAGRGGDG